MEQPADHDHKRDYAEHDRADHPRVRDLGKHRGDLRQVLRVPVDVHGRRP
jgi:hypothetical protein